MCLFNNKRKVYITMNDKREKFASRLGFILVSAGCAVGLGNVWKFPYICGKNGGAAFIVIYLLCLLGLGLQYLYVSMQLDEAVIRALEVHLKCCRQKEQDGIISAG